MSDNVLPFSAREPEHDEPHALDEIDADIARQIEQLKADVPGVRVTVIERTAYSVVADVFAAFQDVEAVRMEFIFTPVRERMRQRR